MSESEGGRLLISVKLSRLGIFMNLHDDNLAADFPDSESMAFSSAWAGARWARTMCGRKRMSIRHGSSPDFSGAGPSSPAMNPIRPDERTWGML